VGFIVVLSPADVSLMTASQKEEIKWKEIENLRSERVTKVGYAK